MMWLNQTVKTWLTVLFLLLVSTLLAACSSGDQMLLAEFNDDGEAEIFLAELGAEESEWQSLAENAGRKFLFQGELAAFVPETNHILLWYIDGNDLRIEQMEIGDDAPNEVFEANQDVQLLAILETDPFAILLTEARDFDDVRCYISLEGSEAPRLARSNYCTVTPNGVLAFDLDRDRAVTSTIISPDGTETVLLDEVEDVFDVRGNEVFSRFVYIEVDRGGAQTYLIEPGDEEGTALGEEFYRIETFGFLPDGETVYVVGRLDEDDDDLGLYLNGSGSPLLEANFIFPEAQAEDGSSVLFLASYDDERGAYVYNLNDETLVEIAEEDEVSFVGVVGNGRYLLTTQNGNDTSLLSVSSDGREVVELLETDDYDVLFTYMNNAAEQLLVQLADEDNTDTLFVTSLNEENGYFLLEEWSAITILGATDEHLIFAGREDEDDDRALYSIAWAADSSETELDDDAEFGFRGVFFAKNGRSIYYTAIEDGLDDTEVRRVPVDGSESPEGLYRDMVLLDVSWAGEPNLQFLR